VPGQRSCGLESKCGRDAGSHQSIGLYEERLGYCENSLPTEGRCGLRSAAMQKILPNALELRDFRLDLQRLEQGPYALGLVDIVRKVDQVSPKRSSGTKNLKQANIKAKPVLARFDQALSRLKLC